MAVSFLTVLHWDQARALFGRGPVAPDFRLSAKRHPLGRAYIAALVGALVTCGILPYAEEFWRCYRTDRTPAPYAEPPQPVTETLRVPA